MNQISEVSVPVHDVSGFLQEAKARLIALNYEVSWVIFSCAVFSQSEPTWRFAAHSLSKTIGTVEADSADECLRQAREWLADLTTAEKRLADILGVAAE